MERPTLYRNKYRIQSIRHPIHDYTTDGAYFITICTHCRIAWFGAVKNGMVGLSEAGCVVANEWQKTGKIRKNVILDTWIVMPNHFHGIIMINNGMDSVPVDTSRRGVSTGTGIRNWAPGALGVIINQFKMQCTKRIRQLHPDFRWQSRYWDRIIRNNWEMDRIRRYIINNPNKWRRNRNRKFYG